MAGVIKSLLGKPPTKLPFKEKNGSSEKQIIELIHTHTHTHTHTHIYIYIYIYIYMRISTILYLCQSEMDQQTNFATQTPK